MALVGVVVSDHILSGWAYAANFGWIHFGDGTPDDGIAYSNTSATDYGVNQDGNGRLVGYAYAANIGWINFEQTHGQPEFSLSTGDFSGYAYSANVGWINLSTLTTKSMNYLDSDGDGIGDFWEMQWFGMLGDADETTDTDGDGWLDIQEYYANTNPYDVMSRARHCLIRIDPPVSGPNGEIQSVYHEFTVTFDRTVVVQYSDDLMNWTDGRSYNFNFEADIADNQTFPASDQQFFRIEYRLPLQP